jgi:hypothetical protein
MPDPAPRAWLLDVLLAVAASAAVGLGFLYVVRPSPGELGTVRVVVADESGKTADALRVVLAAAPHPQGGKVTPVEFAGVVHYPVPYLTKPNLRLVTTGKRQYTVTAETEHGFTWAAKPLPDDFKEDAKKDNAALDLLLGSTLSAVAGGRLKPGIVLEEFAWEAKGLPGPPPPAPPTYEQKGSFSTVHGKEAPEFFPVPYASPPNVVLGGSYTGAVTVTEVTPQGFKWKNHAADRFSGDGSVTWVARGVLPPGAGK